MLNIGAVPFVKTNVPLSLLSYTCGNEIYGMIDFVLVVSCQLFKDRICRLDGESSQEGSHAGRIYR